jgi:hypothetical protein
MAACKHCGRTNAETDFYGSINTYCKEHWRERVKVNRAEKADYYREFDRQRSKTPERIQHLTNNAKKQRELYPQKYVARTAVGNALRDGRLTRQPCEVCGNEKSEAHHDDYSKPLDVKWLCKRHHVERHKQLDS